MAYCNNKWVNFIGYSNQNCSGIGISSIIKTNECIGSSIYTCDENITTNREYVYAKCEKEYVYKTNKNNHCNNEGFTTNCSDNLILPKKAYIIATYNNESDNCSNESNVQQYNIVPFGVCDSGKIYISCKNGMVYYNIYKDLECTQITNNLELRLGCQYGDSTFTYFIKTFCT